MGFKKTIEDFTCEHCGHETEGNGYTNHCPECLWSKHVDIDPGDRKEVCGGLMKPTEATFDKNGWGLTHVCINCNFKRKAVLAKGDSVENIIKIAEEENPSSLR